MELVLSEWCCEGLEYVRMDDQLHIVEHEAVFRCLTSDHTFVGHQSEDRIEGDWEVASSDRTRDELQSMCVGPQITATEVRSCAQHQTQAQGSAETFAR